MNKKLILIIVLIAALFALFSASAGLLIFYIDGNDSNNVEIVENC